VSKKSLSITKRQREVLALLATGATDYEIASRLNIRARTVQFHVDRIKTRLKARTRAEAVVKAHENGILS
jgi:DNA-binding NarL/FixJ family response regulator